MRKKRNAIALFPAAILITVAFWPGAAVPQDKSEGKFSGDYFFYGGTLDDRAPPSSKDTKLSISVSGPFAVRLYRRMGAAAKIDSCDEQKSEARSRGEMICFRERSSGKVECSFGFDMRSGKSITGVIC